MEMTEIILAIIAIVSGVVTHLLSKKKYSQEIERLKKDNDSLSIQNMGKSLDYYEKFVSSSTNRIEEVLKKQDDILKENLDLKEALVNLSMKVEHMNALLCTNLPCTLRVQDRSVIDCIYLQSIKNKEENLE